MPIITENCPVCENKLKEHTVQNFIDCIEKLMKKQNSLVINSSNYEIQVSATIEEALKQIGGLLESPHVKRVMVTPEVSLVVILEKLKKTLEG